MKYTQTFFTQHGTETKRFELVNYKPEIDVFLFDLLNNDNHAEWDSDSVITDVEKLSSESNYELYKVQKFEPGMYWNDKELDDLRNLSYYLDYDYVMVQN